MSHSEIVAEKPTVAVLSTPLFGGAWLLAVNGDVYSFPMSRVSLEVTRMAARILAKAIGAELKSGNDMTAEADYRHAYTCESAREAVEAMAQGDLSRDDMIAMAQAVLRPA